MEGKMEWVVWEELVWDERMRVVWGERWMMVE